MDRDWSNFIGGRTALVTGSGAGMGRAIAIYMARRRRRGVDQRPGPRACGAAWSSEIEQEGGTAHAVVADVCDPESVAAMAAETGPVDILVNNAGTGVRAYGQSGLRLVPFAEIGTVGLGPAPAGQPRRGPQRDAPVRARDDRAPVGPDPDDRLRRRPQGGARPGRLRGREGGGDGVLAGTRRPRSGAAASR